ncbi:MAG TPA: 4-hydroxybenzoate octaprenyltransferase [Devosia sp.]
MQSPQTPGVVADAQSGNWVDRFFPEWLKPYARLARWDRPIPLLLLFWPCAFGLTLATLSDPSRGFDLWAVFLFLVGSVLMRGAGCTFNDIVDTDIDMKVERTRSRPIPSGQVTRKQAWLFLVVQSLLGALILVQFNWLTIGLGVASLALVAIYPFMKRVTWWPQFFLGLAFNWGALLGWTSQTGSLALPPLLLYAGGILWTIGYDTFYAMQDIEDDALIGVKSTARLFGDRGRQMIGVFYVGAVIFWLAAAVTAGGGPLLVLLMLAPVAVLTWQVLTLRPGDQQDARAKFYANHWVGVSFTLVMLAEALRLWLAIPH